jgi:hypothetical protein
MGHPTPVLAHQLASAYESPIQVVRGNAVRTPVKLGLRARDNVEVLRKQTFPVSVGEPTAWEDFTGRELSVRENPSSLSDGQQVQFLDGDRLTDGCLPTSCVGPPRAGLLCPYGAKQLSTGGGNPACGVGPVR